MPSRSRRKGAPRRALGPGAAVVESVAAQLSEPPPAPEDVPVTAPETASGPQASAASPPSPFVVFPEELHVRDIRQFEKALAQGLSQPLALFLDARHVRAADSASLQLVVAAIRRADQTGLDVFWEAVSGEFQAIAQRVGLHGALRLPGAV